MKKSLFAILSLSLLAACSGKETTTHEDEAQSVEEIVVTTGGYAVVGAETRADGEEDAGDTAVDILTSNAFQEGSLLYISQMGTMLDPDFSAIPGTENLYVYKYSKNDAATWEEEFNFKAREDIGNKYPIKWADVQQRGPVGNAFSLYALHFPVDNEVKWAVQTDQRGPADKRYSPENFLKSDILGAYHATSALYTRMRFRLYHLMVYLRVTLYVPVYKADANGQGYSGFDENAFLYAVAKNVCSDFKIEWRTNRSSDTDAPLTNTATSAKNRTIYMYAHPSNQNPKLITDFQVKEYYDKGELNTDDVRVYDFSVLIPGQDINDPNSNLLQFQFRSPGDNGGNQVKNYYFARNQLKSGHNDFGLTQGTLQHLSLYLPRTGNNTIVVGANILPWTDARTEMTVTDQSGQQSSGDDTD